MSAFKVSQGFLDPEKVLFRAGLSHGQTLADLGSGSGHYALAGAAIVGVSGQVIAVDVLESSLAHVSAEARLRMLKNIKTVQADLEKTAGVRQVPDGSCDMVVFGNLLHQIKNRTQLLKESYRLLKTQGRLVIVDWNETPSPIGPKHEDRVVERDVVKSAEAAGFKPHGHIDTDNYHYGLVFVK
jgi:ubiquinone/menaquinone biosynthesis C-methylase UbiE